MALIHQSSPHTATAKSTQQIMLEVSMATLPGLVALSYFFGWGTLIQVTWCMLLAVLCEAFVLKLRNRPLSFYLKDGSAVLTGLLLGLSIPSAAPWWIAVIGVSFSIIIGKQLYGGLGYNPFNPAMLGYVLLLISFPVEMTLWLAPSEMIQTGTMDFTSSFLSIFSSQHAVQGIDGYTMATPLDALKTLARVDTESPTSLSALPQFVSYGGITFGYPWHWVNLSFLLGGVVLLSRGIFTWHAPAGVLLGLFIPASIGYLINPELGNPAFHLLGGATCFAAFFIATDPVSSPASYLGRLIFGLCIGCLVYIIRIKGGYPDAFAFAVLLMNLAAPTLDYYTRPRAYGHDRATRGLVNKSKS